MKRKYLFILCTLFCLMCFTGCGADVTSKLEFEADGSGSRTVYAVISEKDAKNLDNGFIELDEMLEDAAPEGVNLNRTMSDNGDATYQFIFHFDDIDDYNRQVKNITGKEHDATWYTDQESVFNSDIQFHETQCTYDLIAWAIDAFKSSKYAAFSSNFTFYEVGENKVYYVGEEVYSGTDDPEFTKDMTPTVENVSMYSTYSYDGSKEKILLLQFEKGSLEKIDIDQAKQLLNAYSTNYKVDLANSTITFTLKDEQVDDFLLSVDSNCTKDTLEYESANNVLQKKVLINESYNLKEFLKLFKLGYPYVQDYIKVPEQVKDQTLVHTNQLADITVPEGYDFAGSYRFDSDYELNFSFNKMAHINQVNVDYQIDHDLNGERIITIQFTTNDCDMDQSQLKEYFSKVNDTISFHEQEGILEVEFWSKISEGMTAEEGKSSIQFEQNAKNNLKDVTWLFQDTLQFEQYLPNVSGYEWNKNEIPVTYQVNVDEDSGVTSFVIEGNHYGIQDADKGSEAMTLSQSNYVIQGDMKANQSLNLQIHFEKVNSMYYFWIAFVVFLIIAGILLYVIWNMRQGKLFPQEVDELDDIDTEDNDLAEL